MSPPADQQKVKASDAGDALCRGGHLGSGVVLATCAARGACNKPLVWGPAVCVACTRGTAARTAHVATVEDNIGDDGRLTFLSLVFFLGVRLPTHVGEGSGGTVLSMGLREFKQLSLQFSRSGLALQFIGATSEHFAPVVRGDASRFPACLSTVTAQQLFGRCVRPCSTVMARIEMCCHKK